MKKHKLRILPEYADAVADFTKTAEIRKDDRGFETHDVIEFEVVGDNHHKLNGAIFQIVYILKDKHYLQEDYAMLCIKPVVFNELAKVLFKDIE